jgi:uncharacterized phiE125 gp8 family phage protein
MISVQIDSTTGSEIVSTSELKSYARIETSDDDTIIAEIIKAAREKCEAIINRDIVAKTRTLFISNVDPSGEYGNLYKRRVKLVLPYAPINTITSVQTQDSSGTLSAINYDDYGFEDRYIEVTSAHTKNIKIVYTTTGMTFDDLKLAIKQLATTYYDNRADYVKGEAVNKLPSSIENILSPYIFYNEL